MFSSPLYTLIFFCVWLIGLISVIVVRRTMKNKYPLEWKNLGEVGIFGGGSILSSLRFQKFVLSAKFRTLNDKNLNIAGYVTIVSFVLICIGLFLPIVVGIIRRLHS